MDTINAAEQSPPASQSRLIAGQRSSGSWVLFRTISKPGEAYVSHKGDHYPVACFISSTVLIVRSEPKARAGEKVRREDREKQTLERPD